MVRFEIYYRKNSKKPHIRRKMTKYMKKKYSERLKIRWNDPDFQKVMKEALNKKPNNLEKDFYYELVNEIPNLNIYWRF